MNKMDEANRLIIRAYLNNVAEWPAVTAETTEELIYNSEGLSAMELFSKANALVIDFISSETVKR